MAHLEQLERTHQPLAVAGGDLGRETGLARGQLVVQRGRALLREPPLQAHSKVGGRRGCQVQIGQRVSLSRFPADVCRVIRVPAGTLGMLMECVATARAGFTVYYQELYIPPNDRRLIVSDSDAAWTQERATSSAAGAMSRARER